MKYFFEAIITFAQHVHAFMFMALRILEWQGDIIGTPKVYLEILKLILRWYKVRYFKKVIPLKYAIIEMHIWFLKYNIMYNVLDWQIKTVQKDIHESFHYCIIKIEWENDPLRWYAIDRIIHLFRIHMEDWSLNFSSLWHHLGV